MNIRNIYINYKGEDIPQFIDKEAYLDEACEVIVNIHNGKYKFKIDQLQANKIMTEVLECRPK